MRQPDENLAATASPAWSIGIAPCAPERYRGPNNRTSRQLPTPWPGSLLGRRADVRPTHAGAALVEKYELEVSVLFVLEQHVDATLVAWIV